MNIKLIPTVYQELVKLSKNIEVIENKLLITFEKSIIPKVTDVLKSIQKINNSDLMQLLNSNLVDERVRVIINQYFIKYSEKQKILSQFDKELDQILNY